MKLYSSPGSCSLSPHIALREAGITFELEKVDLRSKAMASGGNFSEINDKGYVPALTLDSGEMLTEGVAIVQYIADQKPESKLAPALGTMERYHLMEWLTFVSSEIHKTFSPLFVPTTPDETRKAFTDKLVSRLAYVSKKLGENDYLMGDTFTVADAYLFTVLRWTPVAKVDLAEWPNLAAYFARVKERPAVHAALEAEGLVKKAH